MADHLSPHESQRVYDAGPPQALYELLVLMALAAGWRRQGVGPQREGEWWHSGDQRLYTLGYVIESVLRDRGVDLREPVPGEEAAT